MWNQIESNNYPGLGYVTYSNWTLGNDNTKWQIVSVGTQQLRSTGCDHIIWQCWLAEKCQTARHCLHWANCIIHLASVIGVFQSPASNVSDDWIIFLFSTLKEARRKYEPHWLTFTLALGNLAQASASLANRSSLFRVRYILDSSS